MGLRRSHALVRWLVALLLLPVLLGVIPAAPLSAEQALARDLVLSICTPAGAQDQGSAPGSHDQQCVLCTIGCITFAPGTTGNASAALMPPRLASPVDFAVHATSQSHRPHWRHGAPPRGPPASLNV
jgi:hypothetical protein